jgi:hypothetical protein
MDRSGGYPPAQRESPARVEDVRRNTILALGLLMAAIAIAGILSVLHLYSLVGG